MNPPKNLWRIWETNAINFPHRDAVIHWQFEQTPKRISWKELIDTANIFAFYLRDNGIKKSDICAIIMRHHPSFYSLYMAVVSIGAIPSILAFPNPRLHPDKFRHGLEGMAEHSGLDWILTEKELEEIVSPLVLGERSSIRGIHFPLSWNLGIVLSKEKLEELNTLRNDIRFKDPLLLQHSSGTTGLQKPVMLSHKAVVNHVEIVSKAMKISEQDKIITWLPLYHDMGLIGTFHIPLALAVPFVQIDTFEWVNVPTMMLDSVHKEKGTLAWLPNFAYNLMAGKIHKDELEGLDLSSLRMLINCSEPVRYESHNKFYHTFREYGLSEKVFGCSYAMAETTLVVTLTEPGKPLAIICADRDSLANGILKKVDESLPHRKCVSSGKVIEGCEVKVVDEKRISLEDGKIGELAISSISMFDGYRNYPEKTKEVLDNGWYYSGDYGFRNEDEIYVIGRKKDIIIVAGKNIYPEDIEDITSKVDGVIPGRVIALGEFDEEAGTELISVIAETNINDASQKKKLKLNIMQDCISADINISAIYLVPPRWLIKSSSGKPSRKSNRERISISEERSKWKV